MISGMCDEYYSSYVCSTLGFVAFLVCIIGILMPLCDKTGTLREQLSEIVLYRLYVYQVAASALFSFVLIFQPLAFYFDFNGSTGQCAFVAFLDQFTQCLKLTLLAGVTGYLAWSIRHTFKFTVINEVIYIVVSILIAGVIASIPVLTNTYGAAGGWCWIQSVKVNCSGFIESTYNFDRGTSEQFVLWYVPATLLSLLGTLVLSIIACCSSKLKTSGNNESQNLLKIENNKNFSVTMEHLWALLSYQICFCVFLIAPFLYRIISAHHFQHPAKSSLFNSSNIFQVLSATCAPLWSLSAGIILVVYNIWKLKRDNNKPITRESMPC